MAMTLLRERLSARLCEFGNSRRANVAMMFALLLIPIVGMVGAAVDYSRANSVKADMQAALDATALMLAKNPSVPNYTQPQLQTNATTLFTALFTRPQAQNVSVASTYTAGNPSYVTVSGSATLQSVFMGGILSLLGNNSGTNLNVSSSTTVTYGTPQTIALNIVFDSSASMIVGATGNDVTAISNWVSKNWNLVKPNDPAPKYPGGDNPPCAFACHDVGGSTTANDIVLGLSHAHSAGATTRFDVMVAAAQQLISHVQTETTNNSKLANNVYLFNVMSFDTVLHQWGLNNMSFANATSAVQSVTPGLDTHLSSAMTQLIKQIGSQGDGSSSASPLKFMIMITDGLQSDRSGNWSGGSWAWDNAWGYNTHFGGFDTPIDVTQCQQIKNNGIILAVLETPYVPLTGQSPNVAPYEKTVRKVIYPSGPNTASAVSGALASCASPGYYFQATNSSDIATGFLSLTDKFIYNTTYLMK